MKEIKKIFSNKKALILIPVFILVFIAIAASATALTIELRYRAEEKKILDVPPETSAEFYYFNQLTYKEQLLFKNIKKAAESYQETSEILPYRFSEEEFTRAAKAVCFDCPQLFYLDINSFKLFCDDYKTSISMEYPMSPSSIAKMKMEIEAVSAASMAFIYDAETDFEKAVILHDFLTSACTYAGKKDPDPSSAPLSHTAYGALVNKYAYCDGYAAAYKILLNRCGIECIIAEGATDVQPHLWNIVKQNGKYYHIDCTWNDADVDFVSQLSFHGFFNLSDNAIAKTHRIYSDFTLPKCSDEANYYAQINAKIDSPESFGEKAADKLRDAVTNGIPYIELYTIYTNSEDDYKNDLLTAIDKVNGEYESPVLSRSFRAFSASENGYAFTIQLYYINN